MNNTRGWSACLLLAAAAAAGTSQHAAAQTQGSDRWCVEMINADCNSFGSGGQFGMPVPAPPTPGRAGATFDMTGVWTSVITEDWRWRVLTPPKGDYASVPLNPEGTRVADQWDPESAADTCKHFGAPGLMRNPLRVRIGWENDMTLRVQTDHGMQTRQFHFDEQGVAGGAPSLQGDSVARWHETGLEVVTTNLSAGYLRKNGVPYSEDAVLIEYYDRFSVFEDDWLVVTTVVEDPAYLSREFITSSQFKRLDDDSAWNPVPCGT